MFLEGLKFKAGGAGGIILLFLGGAVFGVFLIKMYIYIGDYKIFRETKTQQALENLLVAQKSYYGVVYVLPLIIISLALLAFILGDLLSSYWKSYFGNSNTTIVNFEFVTT